MNLGSILTYLGVTSTSGAVYLGFVYDDVGAALAVAVVAILAFGVRLSILDLDLGPRSDRVRSFVQKGAALAGVGLLVTTAATSGVVPGVSPVGTASAEWVECSITDPLVGAAYNTIIGADSGCRWESGGQTDVENLTATDAYANGLALKDSSDSYLTQTENFVEDTRTVAYTKAKISLINDINNGTNVSQAKNNANETVEDYYSQIERNIIADWNQKTLQAEYLTNTSLNVYPYHSGHYGGATSSMNSDYRELGFGGDAADQGRGWANYTLMNGSNVSVRYVIHDHGTFNSGEDALWAPDENDVDVSTLAMLDAIAIEDPNNTSNLPHVLDRNRIAAVIDDLDAQASQVKSNMGPVADGYYAEYQAGDINSTELAMLDPSVIAAEASTDLNSTGYYSYAAVQLAAIGAEGSLNTSHNLTVSGGASNVTFDGTLFYSGDDAPAGWDTNTTYNMSSFNGTFYFVVSPSDVNNSSYMTDLSTHGTHFTINEATNAATGESLNTTTIHKYVYEDTNATALQSQIDQLQELRNYYETQASGGSSSGGINTKLLGGALLVGAAAVLLIQREGRK
ncbi:hypothetical protein KU306_12040 [Haloferax larsenii]|uniref:Envelope protein N-terminal domain-containing protein n=1 Tax=Haloferax larsenii TaxID=302484 RepID=A0ABY5RBA6_HALLR|nr:hypothetical protein [Haloferax larsenii]UVE49636.1 hypothetical protein KU306_12040 [Haloferax larsenii]